MCQGGADRISPPTAYLSCIGIISPKRQDLGILQPLLASGFMPHGFCYLWDPRIVWLHVVSDGLIALSYYSIPVGIIYFLRKRNDLPFRGIFWMFIAFLLGCGTAHLMEIWTIWHPTYFLSGLIKAFTAGVSIVTAAMLVPLLPKAVSLPGPGQLRQVNLELQKEVLERQQVETKVRDLNERLEERVVQRTAQLKDIHDALRANQAQFNGIIASAMDAIIAVDQEQKIVLFNQAAEKMFLCPAKDALGSSIGRFIPSRYHAQHAEHIRQFGKTGVTNRAMGKLGALSGLRTNNQEFPIEASISQTEIQGKKLFTAILRDITERKQAEASRSQLAAIVESSADAILSKDLGGTILSWNKGAERLYGYTAEEIVGKPITALTPLERCNEPGQVLQEITQGHPVTCGETMRKRKDGTLVAVSLVISPIRNAEGRIVGASTIAHDITERKRQIAEIRKLKDELEQRVLQRTAQLEAANLELEAFTYSVSHDLRAPLRHIGGFSKLLVEEFGPKLEPEAQHYLERIQEGTRKMGQLVDELLNLARVGRYAITPQVIGLDSILQDVVTMLKPEYEGREVKWQIGDFTICGM